MEEGLAQPGLNKYLAQISCTASAVQVGTEAILCSKTGFKK